MFLRNPLFTGDIQYKNHASLNNLNLMYWKETKNFDDDCSAHITSSYYENGNMALPDQATFIIENTIFGDNVNIEANHHCQVGVTGFLCMPQYIFHNVQWKNRSPNTKWLYFQSGNTNDGGIYTLSPESAASQIENLVFPDGYMSLVSSRFTYLLSAPNGVCVSSISLGLGVRYDNGILCKAPLRSLKIYSRGLVNDGTAPTMIVNAWFGVIDTQILQASPTATQSIPFHQIGSTNKQGYALPVIPGTEQYYKLSIDNIFNGDIPHGWVPHDWVVEFSDPVMGNRWGVEYIHLQLQGRSCGTDSLISSQHDRRFLYSGDNFMAEDAWGKHGACVVSSAQPPDTPVMNCSNFVGEGEGMYHSDVCTIQFTRLLKYSMF